MAGSDETLGSPLIPLAIRAWLQLPLLLLKSAKLEAILSFSLRRVRGDSVFVDVLRPVFHRLSRGYEY
jgi:hypothetical protein